MGGGGPVWVTGGKTRSEYMFSALPRIADIARASFTIQSTNRTADHAFCGSCVLGPSNSMLGCGVTTPQDYPE